MNLLLTDIFDGFMLQDVVRSEVAMTSSIDLTYPNILNLFGNHLIPGRVESRAFLGWFLEHYFRLDETDAQDAVCDGPDDKGIDGIYIDTNIERIIVFQTKLRQNNGKSLGDTDLKEFAGTLDQLKSRDSIEALLAATKNSELKSLILDSDIATLIEGFYDVKGIFVTNVSKDVNASTYLQTRPDIAVFDLEALQANWVPPGDAAPVETSATFNLDGHVPITYQTADATVYVVPLLASELMSMAGVQSGELFAWNVRQTLGKTKVNKAIAESVRTQAEHKNFVLYHNGLTVLTEEATLGSDTLTIKGYTVVNGCQSLTTLFENKASISDELKLLARVIKLPPQSALAAKITRHSNNQNSISARDLQSNSTLQRRIQTEFRSSYPGLFGYAIKRGESPDDRFVITNEEAARQLLAFDLQQPWACHQTYRLFDELHSQIFARQEVTAERIACVWVMFDAVLIALAKMKNQLVARYTLTRFFLLFLLRQALAVDAEGRKFIQDPGEVAREIGFENMRVIMDRIVSDLIVDFDAEILDRERDGNPFDYKRDLKSATAVRSLAKEIIPSYEKAIGRNRATSFSSELSEARTYFRG